ncbi:MAG: hypothetical protein IH946_09415, partial [Bacteroidetes bacterium]|nr:hypothetical protein [Bacteroidota bacterium]
MKTTLPSFRNALLPFLVLIIMGVFNSNAQTITMDFDGMIPHVGQKLEARLISKSTLREVDRTTIDSVVGDTFMLTLAGVIGGSYWIDFYADFNMNGMYNAPPADHAWRMDLDNVAGDTTVTFTHNTNFKDIKWRGMLTFDLTNMTPHVGQLFQARLWNITDNLEAGRQTIDTIPQADFSVSFPGALHAGDSYTLEFYADFDGNGTYDAPPIDHAWDMSIPDVGGDTTIMFDHNTNFTDINWPEASVADVQVVTDTGAVTFIGTGVAMNFTSLTGGDTITVSQVSAPPSGEPPANVTIPAFVDRYWVIDHSGSGSFTVNMTLNLGAGAIGQAYRDNPGNLKLLR